MHASLAEVARQQGAASSRAVGKLSLHAFGTCLSFKNVRSLFECATQLGPRNAVFVGTAESNLIVSVRPLPDAEPTGAATKKRARDDEDDPPAPTPRDTPIPFMPSSHSAALGALGSNGSLAVGWMTHLVQQRDTIVGSLKSMWWSPPFQFMPKTPMRCAAAVVAAAANVFGSAAVARKKNQDFYENSETEKIAKKQRKNR